jgi:sulfate adenylyltransferase
MITNEVTTSRKQILAPQDNLPPPIDVAARASADRASQGPSVVDLRVTGARAATLRAESRQWIGWDLSRRQLSDLELLVTGACAPLTGFMTQRDYESVCVHMRLADGALWPMPITLDVSEEFASRAVRGEPLALRDAEGVTLAALVVEDVWRADNEAELATVYGPARESMRTTPLDDMRPWRVGGRVEALQLPTHYAFRALRHTPAELRADFALRGWTRVVAFPADGPMHRAERELTLRAARDLDASVLIHPAVGAIAPDDPDLYMQVKCWQEIAATYPEGLAALSLTPVATRGGGMREAVWRALVSRNYGCTHIITEPQHAPDARALASEIGIDVIARRTMVFVPAADAFVPEEEVPGGSDAVSVSASDLRACIANGDAIPEWFSFPSIIRELRHTHPPRAQRGFSVFFTGLSGSGKSTIANALLVRLMECARRPVALLDGDIVRKHLSSELGFSKEHRDLNIRRIGYVASEITKAGGIAICCPIAPYDRVRHEVRGLIEPYGGFTLVFIATPLEICERRDRKGLYAKARAGQLEQFTGISDPYEEPHDADVVIDTTVLQPDEAAERILAHLRHERYLALEGEEA